MDEFRGVGRNECSSLGPGDGTGARVGDGEFDETVDGQVDGGQVGLDNPGSEQRVGLANCGPERVERHIVREEVGGQEERRLHHRADEARESNVTGRSMSVDNMHT